MNPNQPLPFEPQFLTHLNSGRKSRTRTGPRTALGAPGYLSVRRAAEILGIQPRSVIDLVARERLSSTRLGRAHFVPVADVERYRRQRQERAARAQHSRPRGRKIKLLR